MSRQLEFSFRKDTCKIKEKAIKQKCNRAYLVGKMVSFIFVLVVNNKMFIHPNTSIIIAVYMKFTLLVTIIESIKDLDKLGLLVITFLTEKVN
jgi:hypothetical protein